MDQTRRSLQDRLDEALLSLGALTSEEKMKARAREICTVYPEHMLLDALVSHLGSANSQLRGGLGLLAQHLPRDKTEHALLRTVLNKHLSSAARLSAVTLLQDYLDRPVQSQFVADIADTDTVVLNSMQEAFATRSQYPGVLIEYTQQFAQLDLDHRTYVLGLLSRVPPTDAAELLRFMAYHRTDGVAAAALDRLGTMASAEAEKALYILSQTLFLDVEQMQTARTYLRRKRFQGTSLFVPPPLPDDARAMPLGFTPRGGLLVQLAIPSTASRLLLEYDRNAGIRRLQPVAMASQNPETGTGIKLLGKTGQENLATAADPDGTLLAFCQWHLSFTLALVPDADPSQPYPEDFQMWAPLLWQWQPPDVPPALRELFEADVGQSSTPHELAQAFARHSLVQEMPWSTHAWLHRQVAGTVHAPSELDKTTDPMYQYFVWWLQTASAMHLLANDPAGSETLVQAATLLATNTEGAALFLDEISHLLRSEYSRQDT